MKLKWKIVTVLLVSSLHVGCQVEDLYSQYIDINAVATLESGVVLRDGENNRLLFLAPTANAVNPRQLYQADKEEIFKQGWAGPDPAAAKEYFQLVVPADPRVLAAKKVLLRFQVSTGVVTRYELSTEFSQLRFDPTGTMVVLYHDVSTASETTAGLFNPNEVAVIDLTKPAGVDNPRYVSVDLNGQRIFGVHFLPALTVGQAERRFAVFTADGIVRLMDVADFNFTQRISLTVPGDSRVVIPDQIIARPGDRVRDPMVFVRSVNSSDIYAIALFTQEETTGGLAATINQYEIFGSPQDMKWVDDDSKPLLLVLTNSYGTGIIQIVDIDTADSLRLDLATAPTTMLERTGAGGQELVIYGGRSEWVYFLRVENLLAELGRNLDDVSVPGAQEIIHRVADNWLLMTSGQAADIVLFNLETRRSVRLATSYPVEEFDFSTYNQKLFFPLAMGTSIDIIDLATDRPQTLLLDDIVGSLHLAPATGMGMVIHPDRDGRVTLFSLANPNRATCKVFAGLWVKNFLDTKAVAQ